MAKYKLATPFAFRPWSVTLFSIAIYAGLLVGLLVIQFDVPRAPTVVPYSGVNLTEAWHDLQFLTDGFHPFNSRRNDEIHDWLLSRLESIISRNGGSIVDTTGTAQSWSSLSANVTVFNDLTTNLTSIGPRQNGPGIGVYFESTNIIVYIQGLEDEKGPWWNQRHLDGPSGTLVNAHYDSVSTGFGATDDGMAVITLLQLVKHFTTEGNQPKHGILVLFNNGEEDYLNGARAFALHPVSRFATAFLNLEGAGAGGRAAIFRSTDTEVTHAYRGTEHPYGTVVTGDGFKRGLVRSQTDYVVFNENLGMRGVDVAFTDPRARYHTTQDDARHTSVDSLWHMLSAALHTTHELSNEVWDKHVGSQAVWFDLFGRSFVNMELHTLFALSVTLLVVAPVAVMLISSALSGWDKLYLFSVSRQVSGQRMRLHGLHGLFRTPFILAIPSAVVIGLAFLLVKVNPFIVQSSPYAVWAMMMSVWFFGIWFLSRIADFARPTALHRLYSLIWMFLAHWVLLAVVTVLENDSQIASGYFVVWNFFAVSVATLIGFAELSALGTQTAFAEKQAESAASRAPSRGSTTNSARRASKSGNRRLPQDTQDEEVPEEPIEGEPTESTSLLRPRQRTTFANYASSASDTAVESEKSFYPFEQEWSANLPSWTWLIQLLILAPMTIILVGQIGLDITTGIYQTLADGSSPLVVYELIGICSILMLVPLTPFIHRFTYHIPTFLLFIGIGTLIYNTTAFPFSPTNPLKVYFIQRVNLDTGINHVSLSSTENPYVLDVVHSLPSAAGQIITTTPSPRADLQEYSWIGLRPYVVKHADPLLPPGIGFTDWLAFNVTRTSPNQAHFSVQGRNTRSCRLKFDKPVSDFAVAGEVTDPRFPSITENGVREIRLWSREWERTWEVNVTWPVTDDDASDGREGQGLDGRVVCLWNQDHEGDIPALEEVRRFAPAWAIPTKLDDGLVEGYKTFFV